MFKRSSKLIWLLILTIFLSQVLIGCEPLKRKFIRKKKTDKTQEEFIPVLEPIDYEAKGSSSRERYKYHYSLWKTWERELILEIDSSGTNQKRQRYYVAQMKQELKSMLVYLLPEKKEQLKGLIVELEEIQKEFDKPQVVRNMNMLRSKIERLADKVKDGFNPNLLKDQFGPKTE